MFTWRRHHLERGGQYTCAEYHAVRAAHAVMANIGRKGNYRDNAAESFFATLEFELSSMSGGERVTMRGVRSSCSGRAWYINY